MLISESNDNTSLLLNIIDSLAVPIFVKNKKHIWILVNNALCSLMNLSKEELIGKTDSDFFPKHQAEFFCKTMKKHLKQKKL